MVDAGWELPEGCGDGVPVPGQLCFKPVPLPNLEKINGVYGLPLDDSGRDWLLVNDDSTPASTVMPLVFDGDRFDTWPLTPGSTPSTGHVQHFDFDGDGRPDIVSRSGGGGIVTVRVYSNLGTGRLAEPVTHKLGPFASIGTDASAGGTPVVIDVDGDGQHEILAGDDDNELRAGSRLYRLEGDEWIPVGPHIDLPGCNMKGASVVGDFDEDGYPDAIVDTGGTYCDPEMYTYDPEWHRFAIFRSNPETGLLDLSHTMPAGSVVGNFPIAVGDIDGDGHLDAVFEGFEGPIFLRGQGDGTFDARVLRPANVDVQGWIGSLGRLGDYDGDGTLEFPIWAEWEELVFVRDIVGNPTTHSASPPFYGGRGSFLGDANGDGISDLVTADPNRKDQRILLVSIP